MFRVITVIIFIGCILLSTLATAESLENFVENASQKLLAQIDAGRADFDSNPGVLYGKVGNTLTSLVDFPTITRGVMGSYHKGATPKQRAAFQETFRNSIIELYTKTLVNFKSKGIRVIPLKKTPTSTATVTMKVTTEDGSNITLIYSMAKRASGWRVRNIIVNGVNLGITYRNQFKQMMKESNNDIEAVIDSWRPETPANKA